MPHRSGTAGPPCCSPRCSSPSRSWGLQRIQRHRHRLCAPVRLRTDAQLRVPLLRRDITEILAGAGIISSSTTWFRDYLYIPLGGSKGSKALVVRNTMIIFLVSGFWHGANWTFIAWGAINAIFFLPLVVLDRHKSMSGTVAEGRWFPNPKELMQMALTFGMACFAWIFFRAQNMDQAYTVISTTSFPLRSSKHLPCRAC